jgi:hypothetical protein
VCEARASQKGSPPMASNEQIETNHQRRIPLKTKRGRKFFIAGS